MKIYHTETQADYDALMIELESDGVTWRSGVLPTKENNWKMRPKNMCVAVSHQVAEYGSIDTYLKIYPDVPIKKYKAKVGEKMKFTKENVEKVIDEYFRQADFESCGDLIAEIHNLDDTPEKVVVPKHVAEWIESKKYLNIYEMIEDLCNRNLLEKIILSWLGIKYPKYGLRDRYDLLALIIINGYTIEPEKLYYIPLPHLETTDGIQQVLSKRKGDKNYFASRPVETLQQRYTKEELEQVPEIYKRYAKLIEEEEE